MYRLLQLPDDKRVHRFRLIKQPDAWFYFVRLEINEVAG